MERFNYHMMNLARDTRGMTQAGLATAIGVVQGTLSKYETGIAQPPAEFVSDLSRVLGFPEQFFFLAGRPYGFPPFHYRKRKKLSGKALGRIVAEMNIRRMHVERMIVSYEKKTNGYIPEIDRTEYQGNRKGPLDIEDVARTVREMWMLPRGPIDSMVEVIEDAGGIVVPCDFGTDLLDAMSQRIDGLPVLFFINMHAPADRIRHTLAHELGHMVLHTTNPKDDEVMEEEADAFAGAFLLPADEVVPQFRRSLDLRHLANMKGYWKVSMAALAVRADRLNLVTPYQKKMFWMEMSRSGYRKREPNEPAREEPKLLKEMIRFHRKSLGYSTEEMAALLRLFEPEFEAMYGDNDNIPSRGGGHLRIIK
jgi:Zn-dependent peptidase ImmA (M78 family)/transcriptional regulator with XRE-family HTH domain